MNLQANQGPKDRVAPSSARRRWFFRALVLLCAVHVLSTRVTSQARVLSSLDAAQLDEYSARVAHQRVGSPTVLLELDGLLAEVQYAERQARALMRRNLDDMLRREPMSFLDDERRVQITAVQGDTLRAASNLRRVVYRTVCDTNTADAETWLASRFVQGDDLQRTELLACIQESGRSSALHWLVPLALDPRYLPWRAAVIGAVQDLITPETSESMGELLHAVYRDLPIPERLQFIRQLRPVRSIVPSILEDIRSSAPEVATECIRVLSGWSPFLPEEELLDPLLALPFDGPLDPRLRRRLLPSIVRGLAHQAPRTIFEKQACATKLLEALSPEIEIESAASPLGLERLVADICALGGRDELVNTWLPRCSGLAQFRARQALSSIPGCLGIELFGAEGTAGNPGGREPLQLRPKEWAAPGMATTANDGRR